MLQFGNSDANAKPFHQAGNRPARLLENGSANHLSRADVGNAEHYIAAAFIGKGSAIPASLSKW